MAALRAVPRLQVGSAPWISEERTSALQIADAEAEEFTFSARNELDWLNEHMAEIFSENQLNVAEIFKTPGKLRGKTPRTVRKRGPQEARAPLSDLFSATPGAGPSPFRLQNVERQPPTFQVAEDPVVALRQAAPIPKPALMPKPALGSKPTSRTAKNPLVDSGYYGSQATTISQASIATEVDERIEDQATTFLNQVKTPTKTQALVGSDTRSEERRTTEGSFQSAKEEQTIAVNPENSPTIQKESIQEVKPEQFDSQKAPSPSQNWAVKSVVPPEISSEEPEQQERAQTQNGTQPKSEAKDAFDDMQSPSEDGSSPIRAPLVRKSSLTFASLPAREPLTTKQSIGKRTSHPSHLDQSRTSYFGRSTGGKSLGNIQKEDPMDDDDMDVDNEDATSTAKYESDPDSKMKRMHNKTSTQRLQDQISMLGQSQTQVPRPSKSIPNLAAITSQPARISQSQELRQAPSPTRTDRGFAAPGAFPEDEEDDWIGPPNVAGAPSIFSPRPAVNKGYSADVMEGVRAKESVVEIDFNVPKQRRDDPRHRSPLREPAIPERTTSTLGQTKSASTSVLRSPTKQYDIAEALPKKGISVSNPNLASVVGNDDEYLVVPKSPSRSFRDSPLKAAKDKVSSILKTSRNLFASSAAVSAAAKGSTLSPPPMRLGNYESPSLEDVLQQTTSQASSLYPSLENLHKGQSYFQSDSPSRHFGNGKAGSVMEGDDKRKEKEAKEVREAQKREDKLERLREKESEKARLFNQQEQERVAAMEKQILAKKEQERLAKASQVDIPRATRTSPRKPKAQLEADGIAAAPAITSNMTGKEIEMADALTMPPPEAPRPLTSSQTANPREQIKRPIKPAKDSIHPTKQAPVVIRVDTGSQRNPQRNLFHPSNASLANSLQDSLAPAAPAVKPSGPQQAIRNKPNVGTVRPKVSTSSFKSVSSTTGKVKALEAAARKKEQEEQEAQRKRNNKLDMDRKRAALQEGKQEQKRQNEADRPRDKQPDHVVNQMDPKKSAQMATEKKLEIERAKQQKPPAPAPRPQPAADLGQINIQDKPLPAPPGYRGELGQARPASRMESTMYRPDEDFGRSVNLTFQNTTKAPPKRPLPQDVGDESQSRPIMQRNGPSNHGPDPKRRKTMEGEEEEMTDSQSRGHMAPPVRQSSMRQKDGPTKPTFPNGYVNVPQPPHGAPLLHKATLNAQHMHKTKPAHPMDMVQNSKAPINFAPNPTQAQGPAHKTPARPAGPAMNGVKSTGKPSAKSSPRYQNGDSIDLPEIPTDSEDEDDEAEAAMDFPIPHWANSPALNQGLLIQETMDPVSVFGLPGEIKLEEVFKNTDRHPRFRARTSSANWSGSDRLTDDEVRRDLEARDRLRREGGWSYGLS